MHILGENLLCMYPQLVEAVNGGVHSAPRGMPVVECPLPVSWTLYHPEQWAVTIPKRRMNPFFALAEVVWMWAGKSGVEFISYYNKNMKSFADPNIPYFNAAYGARVRRSGYRETPFRDVPYLQTAGNLIHEPVEVDQLDHVIAKLQADPDTRQAAVSMWDPVKDNFTKSKDHPCNNMVYFSNRGGALNVTVVIRSNDLIWGTPHNMIQFAHLQALIAGSLDLRVGWLTTMCNNLHFYTELYPPTLSTVLGWTGDVVHRGLNVESFSSMLFAKPWDMRWNLAAFDLFVREVWEPLEKDLRLHSDSLWSGQQDPFYQIKRMHLDQFCNRYNVPEYWQSLFRVMFMFHCRKNNAPMIFNDLLLELPLPMRWLIEDFVNEVK